MHIRGFVWPRQLAEDVHDGAIDASVDRTGIVRLADGSYRGEPLARCRYKKGSSPLNRSLRNTSHDGYGFEKETAERYEGTRIGRSGNPDVVVHGSDGGELVALECERSKRAKVPAWVLEKLEEATRLSRGRRGGPIPSFTFRHKAGPGRVTNTYTIRLADDDAELVKRARQA